MVKIAPFCSKSNQPTMPINAVQVNANGGIYSNGKGHSFKKKLEVYLMLQKLKKQINSAKSLYKIVVYNSVYWSSISLVYFTEQESDSRSVRSTLRLACE